MGGLRADAVAGGQSDLARLDQLAARGGLCGYEVTERFYEIGMPAALVETNAFLRADAIHPASPVLEAGVVRPTSSGRTFRLRRNLAGS